MQHQHLPWRNVQARQRQYARVIRETVKHGPVIRSRDVISIPGINDASITAAAFVVPARCGNFDFAIAIQVADSWRRCNGTAAIK